MNKPSVPFVAPHRIDLNINFDDRIDDQRRIAAENWCCHHTQHRWFRRVLTERGIAQFHFDDQNEATMFWLAN